MKKKTKYLDFYKRCMEAGELIGETINGMPLILGANGLCSALSFREVNPYFDLFEPSDEDIQKLKDLGFSTAYWASDCMKETLGNDCTFTPLRQNIVLFLAAMNNEL